MGHGESGLRCSYNEYLLDADIQIHRFAGLRILEGQCVCIARCFRLLAQYERPPIDSSEFCDDRDMMQPAHSGDLVTPLAEKQTSLPKALASASFRRMRGSSCPF